MSYPVHRMTHIGAVIIAAMMMLSFQAAPAVQAGQIVKFDVAEDPTKFVFDKNGPLDADGWPAYGNAFVTQGYIYPHGTLVDGDPGVDVNGKPLYPEKVIGEWTCYGFTIGKGNLTKTGPWAISEQTYGFGNPVWKVEDTLISNGYEIVDIDKQQLRAVTGGTGKYVGARGQVRQTLLGISDFHSGTFRFEIELSE